MLALRIVLAFSFVLSLGACRRDSCVSVCQKRQKELGCSEETCKATCDQLHTPSPCAAAFRAWEDCIVALPTKQWWCNEISQPEPRSGTCPEARAKVEFCLSNPPQVPSTPAPPPKN